MIQHHFRHLKADGTGRKRVVLYYRVSTPWQVQHGYSLEDQKEILRAYAEAMGWEVVGEYEDAGISGDFIETRGGMDRLVKDTRAGRHDIILTVEDTRLSRGALSEAEEIKKACDDGDVVLMTPQSIIYAPDNDDLDFSSDVRFVVSKAEKKRIRRRLLSGKRRATAKARLISGAAPFGMKFERWGDTGCEKRMVPDEPDAETVRLCYRLIAEGVPGIGRVGLVRVCRHLNDVLGIRAPEGGRWAPTPLARMIRNTAYRGEWHYGPEKIAETAPDIPGGGPVIIAPIADDLWEAANAAIDARAAQGPGHGGGRAAYRNPPALLSRVLKCKECGYALYQRTHRWTTKAGEEKTARTYNCAGREQHAALNCAKCPSGHWPAELIEAAIWADLVRIIESPELLRELIEVGEAEAPAPGDAAGMNGLLLELAKNDRAVEKVKAAYRADTYTLEELNEELAIIRGQREGIERRLQAAQGQVEIRREWEDHLQDSIDLCKEFRAIIRHASADERRGIVERLVQEITLDARGEYEIFLMMGSSRKGQVTVTTDTGIHMTVKVPTVNGPRLVLRGSLPHALAA